MSSNGFALVPNHVERSTSSSGDTRKSALSITQRRRDHVIADRPVSQKTGRSWKWMVAAVVATSAVTAYLRPWQSLPETLDLAARHAVDSPRAVSIDRPMASTTASVVLPATVRPWQTATLHARVSGYLAKWHHDLGAMVNTGDLLAEIDTPELDQELAEGQALAREAEAAVAQAKAERVEAEAELKVAEAQLVRVRAEVELARAQFARRTKLLETRAVSQEEHETFRRDLAVRSADVGAAESVVNRQRTNLKTRTAIIQVREAAAKSRESSVDRLQELQIFKRIVAPFDGVVARRAAEVGMLVTAGEQPLFVVEDISRVRVQINVPQTYAMQTAPGAETNVSLPESSAAPIRATITRVSDSVEAASRTMLAEIELDNVSNHLQPGSYAQVTLKTQNNSSWTIATNTIQMRVEGPHVAVVDDHNEIAIKRVSLGRDLGTRVVAIDGIRGDERLVVNPTDDLTRGVRVQIGQSRESDPELAQW
jgi:multidrug efflux pump subunit AcrA (membrane-fusion protein)